MAECTPQQAAGMFLLVTDGMDPNEKAIKLAGLIELYCVRAYNRALDECKTTYRGLHSGGCQMPSKGDNCRCFLCQVDRKRKPT